MSLVSTAMVGLLVLSDPQATTSENQAPSSRYQLLEFTAEWCGPCQQMSGTIHRLQRQGYPIRQIDVDRQRKIADRFKVNSMPTFIVIADGKEVNRFVGAKSERELLTILSQLAVKYPSKTEDVQIAEVAEKKSDRKIKLPFFNSEKESSNVLEDKNTEVRANNDSLDPADKAHIEEMTRQVLVSDPIGASVRLRIKDSQGLDLGSGTILFSEPGQTVILTCGHIFRNFEESSRIEVDVFIDGEVESHLGEVVKYDLEADVGLISISTEHVFKTAMLQDPQVGLQVDNEVYSIGCGGGEKPTVQKLAVTSLNRYLGPDNVECTGVPVQGRSGGGLFTPEGKIVGVCIAADPKDQRGLYAGLKPIIKLLTDAQVIDDSSPAPGDVARSLEDAAAQTQSIAGDSQLDVDRAHLEDVSSREALTDDAFPIGDADAVMNDNPELVAQLEGLDGAEVVCIIRPLKESRAASRVVIINRASPKFVNYLTEELSQQPQPTSARIEHKERSETSTPKSYSRYRRSAR